MRAHRTNVTVSESHQLLLDLPNDFPAGPAEVIVLADERPKPGNIVRLGGVLTPTEPPSDGDPIEEALRDLRSERSELLEQRAVRYTDTVDEP